MSDSFPGRYGFRRLYLAALLCVIGVGAVAFFLYGKPSARDDTIAFWRHEIGTLGPSAAYEKFTCSIAGDTDSAGHQLAHVFGAALYLEKGLDAVAACDDKFQYGCLHEFFGRAIAEHGLSVIPQLDAQCKRSSGTDAARCEHGLGHGILAYYGYDVTGRDRAVTACHQVSDVGACESGLFMEYFNQTMLADQAKIPQETAASLMAGCATLPPGDQSGCVFEMPRQWRKDVFPNTATTTKTRVQIGLWCESYKQTPALYRACGEGMGNDLYILTHGDAPAALELCRVSAQSAQTLAYCTAQVRNLLQAYRVSESNLPACTASGTIIKPD